MSKTNFLDNMKFPTVGHSFHTDAASIALSPMIEFCIKHKHQLYSYIYNGYVSDLNLASKFAELSKENPLINLISGYDNVSYNDETFLQYRLTKNNDSCGYLYITTYSLNENLVKNLNKLVNSVAAKHPSRKGRVFSLYESNGDLSTIELGFAGVEMEKTNYSAKVKEGYSFAVKELKSNKPSGRIILLNGPPGCGKSYLIRSFLMELENATFLMIPPQLLENLQGPKLVPVLLGMKEDNDLGDSPIVIILEDADQCLSTRKAENMNSISTILNLGDGIFGSLFDIRIIATTNSKTIDIDPAVLRNGRLSAHLQVEKLSAEEATDTLLKLMGKEDKHEAKLNGWVITEPTSLADIYAQARKFGWEP